MICWGVPRTLPSGPELSKTRLTMLPSDRGLLRDLLRERDLEDLIVPMFLVRRERAWMRLGSRHPAARPGRLPDNSRNAPATVYADDPCGASCPCHAAC